jgi:hypothetical protein
VSQLTDEARAFLTGSALTDAFTSEESQALIACGNQMAAKAFQRDLSHIRELAESPSKANWPFLDLLEEITSTAATTPRRNDLLAAFRAGCKVRW